LPEVTVRALQMWKQVQPVTDGPVFTTGTGGPIDHHNMGAGAMFSRLCKQPDRWQFGAPRTAAQLLVCSEQRGDVHRADRSPCRHSTTHVTEQVYRKELRAVLRAGGLAMGELMAGLNGDDQLDEAVAN